MIPELGHLAMILALCLCLVQATLPLIGAWRGDHQPFLADGRRHGSPRLHLRGPIAVLSGRDVHGRLQRFCWWPDTLSPGLRRQLRLAASAAPLPGHPLAHWPA